jgi:hypothetical protein
MSLPVIIVPVTTCMLEAESREERPRHRVFRGDTIRLPFQVVDRETGGAIDITEWTVQFTAKYALPNPDAQAALAQDNVSPGGLGGIVLVGPTLGQGIVTVQPISTRRWGDGDTRVVYDLQATDPGGVVTTVEIGELVVVPDVTQAI